MDLRHLTALRALEAALRLGSFAAAARELHVTPAAVGQQIRALEAASGTMLFVRHPAGARPTPEAAAVAADLSRGFARLSGAWTALRTDPARARLAIATTPAFAEHFLPPHLPGFLDGHPTAEIRIEAGPENVDLFGGAFDMAIRNAPRPGPDYDATFLFPEILVPVCTPDFARRYGLAPGRRSLDGVPLAHANVPTRDPGFPDWPRWAEATGVALGGRAAAARFSGYGSALRFARGGLCLALASAVQVVHALDRGELVAPLGPGSRVEAAWGYWLLRVAGRPAAPLHRAFRAALLGWLDAARDSLAPHLGPLPGPPAAAVSRSG